MDDETLDQAMLELRRRVTTTPGSDASRTAECLTFARARELALDPRRESHSEEVHLTGCRRCQRILSGLTSETPHPSLWTLIRRQLGTLLPAERPLLQYHLESGGCRNCLERVEQLRSATAPLELSNAGGLMPAGVVRAAVPGPTVLFRGGDASLEAELVRDDHELTLEVRTREAALNQTLVAFALQDDKHQVLLDGFLVLAPDVEGWWSAETRIAPEQFEKAAADRSRSLAVTPVEPGSLSADEWRRVVECAPSASERETTCSAWATFATGALETAGQIPDTVRSALLRLRETA